MEAGVVVFVRPVRVGGGGIEEDVVDEGGDIDFAGLIASSGTLCMLSLAIIALSIELSE